MTPFELGLGAPNYELPAGAVSVACPTPPAIPVSHEGMPRVAELSNQSLDRRLGRNRRWFQQRIEFVDITHLTTIDPDVCLRQSQPLGHADSRAFRSFWPSVPDSCRAADASPPSRPRPPPKSSQACGGEMHICFA